MTSLRHCGDHWSELLPLLEHNRPTFLVFSWGPVSFSDKLRLCLISTERERERGSGKCFFHIEIDTLKHIIKKNPNGSIKYFWPSVLVSRICTRSSVCNRKVENKTSAVAATFSPLPFSHIKRSDCGAWHQSVSEANLVSDRSFASSIPGEFLYTVYNCRRSSAGCWEVQTTAEH